MQLVIAALIFAVGVGLGYLILQAWDNTRLTGVKNQTLLMLQEATDAVERLKQDRLTEARDEVSRLRQEANRDVKERRAELQRAERKLEQREENLDRKLDRVSHKEDELKLKQEAIEKRGADLEALIRQQSDKLEEIAQMTKEDAQEILLRKTEEDAQYLIGLRLKELEERAQREADRRARDIVVAAMQRCAVESAGEATVSVVPLPSEEMKGRIIGREGRNIRAFEMLTGVDLIIDDTPEAVTLSSFDPARSPAAPWSGSWWTAASIPRASRS